ncbi:MAG: winged helix-turn-helix domain-containing protein [Kordiimonas sp.]
MSDTLGAQFIVGDFEADMSINTLSKGEETSAVEPRVMEVLHYLAQRQNQVISRYELMDEIWHSNVSDGAISRVIGLLRKALNDNADTPEYIQTVAKKGYRLIAPVTDLSHELVSPKHKATAPKAIKSIFFAAVAVFAIVGAILFFHNSTDVPAVTIKTPRFAQLTSDPGFEYDATLSQDENWLLYRHRDTVSAAYNLFLSVRDTGEVKQLTNTNMHAYSPAFSRDQRHIAYFMKGQNYCRLKMLTLDASAKVTEERELYTCGAFDHYSNVVWAKDGKSVYFTDRASAEVPYQIHQLQIATGRVMAISQSNDTYYGDNELALSPSGKQLAFFRNKYWGNNEVYIMDLATGIERKVKELGYLAWNISWTADEKHLLFSDNRNGGELLQINTQTGDILSLYYAPQSIISPELSSSGRSIIYATEFADVDMWERPLGDMAITPKKMIGSSSRIDMQPVTTPDGKKTLFLSDRNGSMQLWLRNGEQLTAMTSLQTQARIDRFVWHPDGQTAFIATSDKVFYKLDTESNSSDLYDLGKDAIAYPTLSPDGTTLYYTSDQTGDWQLWKVDLQTHKRFQVTRRGGYQSNLSPDGKRLFYTQFRQDGIWELELETGESTQVIVEGRRNTAFSVCNDAIFYQRRAGNISLLRHDLKTGNSEELLSVPSNAKPWFGVTDNCSNLHYSTWDNVQSDIAEFILQ